MNKFEIVFVDRETDKVMYAVTDVTHIRYITQDRVGFVANATPRSCSFPSNEKLEVNRVDR